MRRKSGYIFLFGLLVLTLSASAAQRTFVSAANGNDANPCTRPLPCRSFAAALPFTDAAGEVIVVDSGGYGAVTITQSVSLISPDGVHAGITTLESAGPGVTVDAGDTAQVILRNLSLISFAATDPGIDALTVGSLHVEHCSVTVFSYGIRFGPSTTGARLYVSDTTIRRSSLGLIVNGGTGVKAMVDGVRIADTLFSAFGFANADALIRNSMAFGRSGNSGFVATGTAKVVIEDSTSAGYSYGFTAADGAVMLVNRSSHAFGYFGMFAESNGSIYASNCTLAGNNTAIFTQTGGVVMTRGDNNLQPNVSTGAFSGNFTTQ